MMTTPSTRRELRVQKTDPMPSNGAPRRPPRRLWLWMTLALLLIILGASAFIGSQIYDSAMSARSHLEAAMVGVQHVRTAVLAGDLVKADKAAEEVSAQTADAVAATKGRLWGLGEKLPYVGGQSRRRAQARRGDGWPFAERRQAGGDSETQRSEDR